MEQSKQTLVIVGGGTAGWMTAAMIARFLETGWRIVLVESDAIGTVGVGESTIPQIQLFNAALGLDEDDFLRATQGTIKLGIEFDGWTRPGERYMHAFGTIGRGLGLTAFHHYWLRARAAGSAQPLAAYSLNESAARRLKLARQTGPQPGVVPPMPYAFQFDAGLYAAYLRQYAEARGVERFEGRIVGVKRHGESGHVAAVRLEGERMIAGDLFVDASGFRSLLLGEALGVGFEDWSHWLPCDRAMAVPCAHGGDFTPYTRATARTAGWQWRIPLQHRIGNGYVYASRHISDDEAAATLLANLDGEALTDPKPLRFTAGKRDAFFVRNVVAIGLSSGFLEPLESTSIHLVQTAIARLLDLLPGGPVSDAARAEYNRLAHFEIDRVRDFLVLHYHANQRTGEALWDHARTMDLPEELDRKLALWRATANVSRLADELFAEPAWIQALIGQGVIPDHYHPLADQFDRADLDGFLSTVATVVDRTAAAMPSHADFIARHCAAPARSLTA